MARGGHYFIREKLLRQGDKMALRGEMVRFMAEKKIADVEEMKSFDRLGYQFCVERSTEKEFVFLK